MANAYTCTWHIVNLQTLHTSVLSNGVTHAMGCESLLADSASLLARDAAPLLPERNDIQGLCHWMHKISRMLDTPSTNSFTTVQVRCGPPVEMASIASRADTNSVVPPPTPK